MSARRPTLDDVAALTGVSGKTVARVVNGEKGVGEKTRERVMEAVRALGYRPNISARSLASARTYRLGVISPYASAYYIAQLQQGAAEACRDHGYQLTIEHLDLAEPGSLERFAGSLRDQPLDGVFLAAPLSDDGALLDLLDERSVRYVRHSPMIQPERSDAVFADEAEGSAAIARHLWSLGHRRFGFTRGPSGHLATQLRRDGFFNTIEELAGTTDNIHEISLEGYATGLEFALARSEQLRSAQPSITAIVTFNDEIAAGVLVYAHQNAIAVPGELAVTGFGNADYSVMTWPQLTTVRQPNSQMAALAIDWLASPSAEVRSATLPVELIVRGSSDPSKAIMTSPQESNEDAHSAPARPSSL